MKDPFDAAEYYDCCDSEEYVHKTPGKALTEFFGPWSGPGEDMKKIIRKCCPIEVKAHKRRTVDDGWIVGVAHGLAESFAEKWNDEDGYGDPYDDDIPNEDLGQLACAITPVVKSFIAARLEVWACEQVAVRSYTADEALEMMREENPHWFGARREP